MNEKIKLGGWAISYFSYNHSFKETKYAVNRNGINSGVKAGWQRVAVATPKSPREMARDGKSHLRKSRKLDKEKAGIPSWSPIFFPEWIILHIKDTIKYNTIDKEEEGFPSWSLIFFSWMDYFTHRRPNTLLDFWNPENKVK